MADSIMIVAHPDDEVIFGAQELFDGTTWKVICLTNRSNFNRARSFRSAMSFAKVDYDIWDYPDEPGLSRDPTRASALWLPFLSEIVDRLSAIITRPDTLRVVTHSADGEYGHEHHKIVSRMTKKASGHVRCEGFAVGQSEIAPDILQKKFELLSIYGQYISPRDKERLREWISRGTTSSLI